MCLVVEGGGSVAGWLPAGGIRASQGTFSSSEKMDPRSSYAPIPGQYTCLSP